jgi:hypothetical protein
MGFRLCQRGGDRVSGVRYSATERCDIPLPVRFVKKRNSALNFNGGNIFEAGERRRDCNIFTGKILPVFLNFKKLLKKMWIVLPILNKDPALTFLPQDNADSEKNDYDDTGSGKKNQSFRTGCGIRPHITVTA